MVVVAIGGDGTVYEIFQGLQDRPDCDEILSGLKIGHIAGGTSNGLSATLAHANQVRFRTTL